ncbi:hypothetical protein [Thermosulfurimonas dismutans]|uniref:OmpH family outer membrane protein n=1 Tax=Thermosulfurimonas dismutans TaxID=999894 RepID=A0A179D5Y5_9BACT|nr:hypothetical protein [Thermosulfurimonas dismutans]OAQ21018.1 hypothetical protein TDIS_0944 [Thermosulfurimonas dismutans]
MSLALLISLALLAAAPALAEDPVSFIVARSPELSELSSFNRSRLSNLTVKLRGTVKQGQETLSGLTAEERARVGYDLRLIAELPLFSPKERLEMRLRELRLRRRVRQEAARAVARYRSLKKTVARRQALVAAVREECLWLKRRVEAGLEPSERVISCVKELEGQKEKLETLREELSEALETVLSMVGPGDRERLKEILDAEDR